jgi:thiol-disulfide isomerase/thioredoxin
VTRCPNLLSLANKPKVLKPSTSGLGHLSLLLCVLVLLFKVIGLFLNPYAVASGGERMLIFTAQWSAKSRDILPLVQSLGQQAGVSVQIIDVDAPEAPSVAKSIGMSIPSSEPPQVYLLRNGQVQLLLDSKNYNYSNKETIKASILNHLAK